RCVGNAARCMERPKLTFSLDPSLLWGVSTSSSERTMVTCDGCLSTSSTPASVGCGAGDEKLEQRQRARPDQEAAVPCAGQRRRGGWLVSHSTGSLRRRVEWSAATRGLVMNGLRDTG